MAEIGEQHGGSVVDEKKSSFCFWACGTQRLSGRLLLRFSKPTDTTLPFPSTRKRDTTPDHSTPAMLYLVTSLASLAASSSSTSTPVSTGTCRDLKAAYQVCSRARCQLCHALHLLSLRPLWCAGLELLRWQPRGGDQLRGQPAATAADGHVQHQPVLQHARDHRHGRWRHAR